MKYQAILFHPEGDHVHDFHDCQTKEEVWDRIANMGSRWIFYPIAFVATDKRIVDAPEGLEFLKGKTIRTAEKFFAAEWKQRAGEICEMLNGDVPLSLIYWGL